MNERPSGQIITFYSYKGGTGRTMALANIACLLARADSTHEHDTPARVLAIDWDLEAPGLHQYLQPYLEPDSATHFPKTLGCLELFQRVGSERSAYDAKDFVGNRRRARSTLEALDLEPYLLVTRFPGLSVMKAGLFDDDYARRVSEFDWDDLFRATVGLFAGVADFLRARFDYVLIDSRTGITDTSGICTMLLPDKLVVVFTPNQQSLTGIEGFVRKAVAYRKGSPDGRPLAVFPLPSRVETARPQLLDAWRNGGGTGPSTEALLPVELSGYQPTFERLFEQIYARAEIHLDEYFNEVMLQHVPDYAYGEPVAVALEAGDTRISLSRSYTAFRDRLVELDVPWESLQVARLSRDIVRRCEVISDKLRAGAIEGATQLGFALLEHTPPESLFARYMQTILDVARATYPRNSAVASALIRQSAFPADADSDIIGSPVLGQVLLDAGKLSQEFGDLELAMELSRAGHESVSGSFGAEHPATLAAMDQMASVLRAGGDIRGASALYSKVLIVRRSTLGEEHPDTLTSMSNLAELLPNQGDPGTALALQKQVLSIRRRVLGNEHPDTLTSMNNLAELLRNQRDFTDSRALQEQVLSVRRRVLGDEHPNTLMSMNNLAEVLRDQGDLATARTLHEQALSILRRVLGEEHPDTLTSMNNLAEVLRNLGDLASARALEEKVLSGRYRVLGEEHPDTLTSMNNLAELLRGQRDLTGARALREKVLSIRSRVLGEEHPDTLASMNNLAELLRSQHDLTGARTLHEQALSIRRRTLGDEHPDTLRSMNNLAWTLRDQGDFTGARALQEQVLATYRKILGEEHPDTLRSMNTLARTLRDQGDFAVARALQEKVLATYRKIQGEEHPDTLAALESLAITAHLQGRLDETREMVERVLQVRTRILGDTHPATIESMRYLAGTLQQLGETARALDLLTRAFDLQTRAQNGSER